MRTISEIKCDHRFSQMLATAEKECIANRGLLIGEYEVTPNSLISDEHNRFLFTSKSNVLVIEDGQEINIVRSNIPFGRTLNDVLEELLSDYSTYRMMNCFMRKREAA